MPDARRRPSLARRAAGAAALVTGVVAQFLEQHPAAGPAEGLQGLREMATQGAVLGAGAGTPTALLFTNLTQLPAGNAPWNPPASAAGTGGGGGLSTGAVAAVAVAASVGEAAFRWPSLAKALTVPLPMPSLWARRAAQPSADPAEILPVRACHVHGLCMLAGCCWHKLSGALPCQGAI